MIIKLCFLVFSVLGFLLTLIANEAKVLRGEDCSLTPLFMWVLSIIIWFFNMIMYIEQL